MFDYARFENDLAAFRYGLKNHMNGKLRDCQNRLQAVRFRLDSLTPEKQLLQKKQRLTDALNFLNEQMGNTLAARREKLIACSERLHGLSPLKRLSEGYAFISGADGTPVHSVQQLLPGDSIEVTLSDGSAHAQVQDIKKEQPL